MNSQGDNYKRFLIKTLGCKVNQYESQAMREILLDSGFKECLAEDIADIYIVNTCTVTDRADKESRYLISLFHRTNPKAKIVMTGCYVEHDSDKLSFLPGISHIVKNDEKIRIADILNNSTIPRHSPLTPNPYGSLAITNFKDHTKAFVKVQDGCENFCSYCKVPLVRGIFKSRPLTDILTEVNELIGKGFKEIVFTGVCLGAWGKDSYNKALASIWPGDKSLTLCDLLRSIDRIPGDFRIRLSSIEPKYVSDELIEFISNNKRMCRHLHIPLQSGDDEILKLMNRPYTSGDYKALIERINSKMGDAAVTTDVMIGFPGEGEANFKNTINLIRDILPARTHIFKYSKRPGTKACEIKSDIGKDVLKGRYYELLQTTLSASYLYRSRFLNKTLDVLVETKRDKHSGFLTGYSDNYIKVLFQGPDSLMRNIASVKVEDATLLYTLGVYDGA